MFPIQLWTHWEHEEKRTDNDLEGYNCRLSVFLKSHPNIWKFIEAIKVEETTFALKFIRLESGLYCTLLFFILCVNSLSFHYAIDTLLSRGRNKLDVERDLEITRNKCKYLQVQNDRAELDINSAVETPRVK